MPPRIAMVGAVSEGRTGAALPPQHPSPPGACGQVHAAVAFDDVAAQRVHPVHAHHHLRHGDAVRVRGRAPGLAGSMHMLCAVMPSTRKRPVYAAKPCLGPAKRVCALERDVQWEVPHKLPLGICGARARTRRACSVLWQQSKKQAGATATGGLPASPSCRLTVHAANMCQPHTW